MRADDGVHGSTSGMDDVHVETAAQHQIKYNVPENIHIEIKMKTQAGEVDT